MYDNRRHFRLREFLDVSWKVDGEEASGEGTVMNISSSGMLLQTDRVFESSDDSVLSIEASDAQELPFAPKKGKIMWLRRIHTPQERYQCGIRFLEDKGDNSLQQWLSTKIEQLCQAGDVNVLGKLVA
jgi:Tfp pilus assembly protein PilZ